MNQSETVQAAQRLLAELTEAAQSAFITSESCGATAEYRHVFKFRTLAELHAFGRVWTAVASMQPAPAPEDAERRFGPITSDPADAERNLRAKEEDAERAAYLERWKDAPEWADQLQQFPSEHCIWTGGGWCSGAGHNLLGSVRCEPRPTPAGGQGVEG